MSLDKLKLEVMLSAIDKITRPLKAIQAGSSDTARALKAAREQLKELNHAQERISSFQKLAKDAAITANTLKTAQAEVKRIKQEIDKVPVPTRDMARAFTQAREQAAKLKEEHSALIIRQQRLRDALKNSGIETGQLGEKQRELKSQMAQATGEVGKQSAALEELNRRQKTLRAARADYDKTLGMRNKLAGAGAATAAAGAVMGMPVVKSVKDYAAFEDAMMGVARQVDGAKDANGRYTKTYYEMGDAIKALSEKLPLTSIEFANIIEAAARMGIQGKENLLAFADTAAKSAIAFDLPVTELTDQMAKLAGLYKIPIKDISGLGDAINYLDDNALAKGGDIINVMQRIAGITESVGMSYKQSAALASTFLSMGDAPEVAATASSAMIMRLSNAPILATAKRYKAGLDMLGLDAHKLQNAMTKDATGTLKTVMDAINALPMNKQLEASTRIFGVEYGHEGTKLAQNMKLFREQLELVNNEKAKGSMDREAISRTMALSAQYELAKNSVSNLSSELGETLKPGLVDILKSIKEVLIEVRNWTKEHPELTSNLVKGAAIIAVTVTALGALMLAAAAVLGPLAALKFAMVMFPGASSVLAWLNPLKLLGAAFNGVGTAIMWAGRALLMNPLGIGIAAIALGAMLIYKYWAPIKEFFAGLWSGISTSAGPALQPLWNSFKSFATVLSPVFGWVIDKVSSLFGWLMKLISPIDSTGGAARSMGESVGLAVGNIISACLSIPTKFFELGSNIMQGIGNGILSGLGYVKDALTGAGASMIGWFKEKLGIHSPSRVFAELGGFTMQGLTNGLNDGHLDAISSVKETAKKLTAIGAGIVLGGTAFAGQQETIHTLPTRVQPAYEMRAPETQQDRTQLAPRDNGVLRDILDQSKQLLARISGSDMGRTLIDRSADTQSAAPMLQDQAPLVPRQDNALGNLLDQAKQLISRIAGGAGAGSEQPIKWDNRPPIASATRIAQAPVAPIQPIITINAAPGMDEQYIAQLVAREIEKISRQQAANARSRLTDRE